MKNDTKLVLKVMGILLLLYAPILILDYITSWTDRYRSWPWITATGILALLELVYLAILIYSIVTVMLLPLGKIIFARGKGRRRHE